MGKKGNQTGENTSRHGAVRLGARTAGARILRQKAVRWQDNSFEVVCKFKIHPSKEELENWLSSISPVTEEGSRKVP